MLFLAKVLAFFLAAGMLTAIFPAKIFSVVCFAATVVPEGVITVSFFLITGAAG